MNTSRGKVDLYAVVYCQHTGMPKIDNPLSVPDVVWHGLSQREKDHVNNSVLEHLRRYD